MEELNYLGRAISGNSDKAQYDAKVKEILSDKQVLAWILKGVTSEFRNFEIEDIIPCIENPFVESVPVYPGLTNEAITGLPQESKLYNEGTLYYDVRFFARVPNAKKKSEIHIIVDVEAQKSYYPGYDIVSRAILYCGRMLSEQLGRNVSHGNYDDLEKVYSIWICMNCPQQDANTISSYKIGHESLYGRFEDDARSDLMRAVVIRLPGEDGNADYEPSRLHSMLSDLLSDKSAEEKATLLEKRYNIHTSKEMKEAMTEMCNLSYAIEEKGLEKGRAEGEKEGEIKVASLMQKLFSLGRVDDAKRAAADPEFREKLYQEFELDGIAAI